MFDVALKHRPPQLSKAVNLTHPVQNFKPVHWFKKRGGVSPNDPYELTVGGEPRKKNKAFNEEVRYSCGVYD